MLSCTRSESGRAREAAGTREGGRGEDVERCSSEPASFFCFEWTLPAAVSPLSLPPSLLSLHILPSSSSSSSLSLRMSGPPSRGRRVSGSLARSLVAAVSAAGNTSSRPTSYDERRKKREGRDVAVATQRHSLQWQHRVAGQRDPRPAKAGHSDLALKLIRRRPKMQGIL